MTTETPEVEVEVEARGVPRAGHFGTERAILVHCHDPIMLFMDMAPVHCFGPFDSFDEAEAFDRLTPDSCFAIVIPLVGPADSDIGRSWPAPEANT